MSDLRYLSSHEAGGNSARCRPGPALRASNGAVMYTCRRGIWRRPPRARALRGCRHSGPVPGLLLFLNAGMDFRPVLETALALGVRDVRIWAGAVRLDGSFYQPQEIAQGAQELRAVCRLRAGGRCAHSCGAPPGYHDAHAGAGMQPVCTGAGPQSAQLLAAQPGKGHRRKPVLYRGAAPAHLACACFYMDGR